MGKQILFVLIWSCITAIADAQELQAKVSINSSRVNSTVDRKVFVTLQNQLTNLLNNRKWTNDVFKQQEKIQCSFILNIESVESQNLFKATLIIQAARPVYQSSYQAALLNFQDPDVYFKYQEFQPVEFNENRVQGSDPLAANLTAVFAFYVYTILGLDYDSFSPKGGDAFFQKAQNIVNNAPEGRNISGWRVFDGLRNRYWLSENMLNSRYNIIHDIVYSYYRSGLDKLYASEKEARANLLQSLIQLQAFNRENPNTMFLQVFMQGKATELVGIFKKAPAQEKSRALDVLSTIDIVNAGVYKQELK